jgi:hypothetical protein
LQKCSAKPDLADQSGGPDFICADGRFMVEATAFTTHKVTSDSILPNEISDEVRVQAYAHLTRQISEKAGKKHSQLAVGKPALLAIASDHVGATLLFDTYAAACLITGEPFWTVASDEMSVNFTLSAFLRQGDGNEIITYNTGISAIILVAITHDASYVCGALHPKPDHPFDSRPLWEIPFIQCKDWPIGKKRIRLAWTMGTNPRPHKVDHGAIRVDSP